MIKTKKQDQQQKRNKPILNDNKVQCKDVLEGTNERKFRQEVIIRKVKRQTTGLQKMFISHISDKRLVFEYKQLCNLKQKDTQAK